VTGPGGAGPGPADPDKISTSSRIRAKRHKSYNPDVPGTATQGGWAAPPLSELIVRSHPGAGLHTVSDHGRVVADLLSVRGAAGRFLVPADSRATAARSLLAYNRLRPRRVRAVRAAMGWALRAGAADALSEPRRIVADADAPVLLDHLAHVLGESRVVFAGTEKGGSGFVTPVLQLFTPDGTSVGFAKIGWDPVTIDMVRAEADGLELAGRAGWDGMRVPEVSWRGEWQGLELLVTAPMPRRVRRLHLSELPPVEPLLDVALLDGPLTRETVTGSRYWADALATAADGRAAGRDELTRHLDDVARDFGDAELTFGRWHGDWVEWNLARAGRDLWVWDWAYSAPGVPFGFDLLQFFHLRHKVLREAPGEVALQRAATEADPGLGRLGIPADERRAVVALHRAEVLLREERARQARAAVGSS
jgi:hypothetical protein